jgi:hypothetical protein
VGGWDERRWEQSLNFLLYLIAGNLLLPHPSCLLQARCIARRQDNDGTDLAYHLQARAGCILPTWWSSSVVENTSMEWQLHIAMLAISQRILAIQYAEGRCGSSDVSARLGRRHDAQPGLRPVRLTHVAAGNGP